MPLPVMESDVVEVGGVLLLFVGAVVIDDGDDMVSAFDGGARLAFSIS